MGCGVERLDKSDQLLVTGGSGFVGAAVLRAWPRTKAMSRSAALALQWLVLTREATSSMRRTIHSCIARIGRRDVDHSPLDASGAEECACRRGKLAELPAGIDRFQQQGDKDALEIRTGRERPSLQQSAVHVSDDNPARVLHRGGEAWSSRG